MLLHLSSAAHQGCHSSCGGSGKEERFLKFGMGKSWEYFQAAFFLLHSLLCVELHHSVWPNGQICLLREPDCEGCVAAALHCVHSRAQEKCICAVPFNEHYRIPVTVDKYVVQCPVDFSNPCLPLSTELRRFAIKAEETINVSLYRVNVI